MDMTKQERIEEYQMEYDYIRGLLGQNPDDDLIDAMYDTKKMEVKYHEKGNLQIG